MAKMRVTMTLDPELVAEVTEAAWRERLSRSEWVERLLADGLAGRGFAPEGERPAKGAVVLTESATQSPAPRPVSPSGGKVFKGPDPR